MKNRSFQQSAGIGLMTLSLFAAFQSAADSGGATLGFTAQGQPVVNFDPIAAAMEYQIDYAPDLNQPFSKRTDGAFGVFAWSTPQPVATELGFYRLSARLIPPDKIAGFNLLNRIAYGPTPDDLERVNSIGPDAYIAEQLAAESLADDTDTPVPQVGWQKAIITGYPTVNDGESRLVFYLSGIGDAYIDDVRLVAGDSDDGTKPNLVRDGGFETTLTNNWIIGGTVTNSSRSAVIVHSGNASLHLVDDLAGSEKDRNNSVWQLMTPTLPTDRLHTFSFWYYLQPSGRFPIGRLGGSGRDPSNPGQFTIAVSSLNTAPGKRVALDAGTATKDILQGWHAQRAIQSPRQLNEVLRQFLENHFVTEYSKTFDYLDGKLPNAVVAGPTVRTEYRENQLWAQALLNPAVTFYDLLKISAESPAMIIYLDTVGSVGAVNGSGVVTKIANENYAREILELFCFGVDNGYDQQDIVQLSRVWTGWTVEFTAPGQEFNPLATKSTVYIDPTIVTNKNNYTNLQGQWSFIFKSANHYTGPKYLFSEHNANGTLATNQSKVVPARFGAPWAGRAYQLKLPQRTGTAGLQDGYDVLNHMANQPFTEEFLCVKLCRLFVHDDFALGYDFTDNESTPEEDLVHQMMLAWESPPNGGPKGQLRPILKVLLNSALFRSSLTSSQKVKTPFEFAVSSVRALRAGRGTSFTADTDGTSLVNSSGIVRRAGRMDLFNRAEPDGYPESAPGWISAGTLAERLRFVQALLIAPGQTGHADAGNSKTDPVGLLRAKNVPITDSAAVADYFLGLLFPSEGAANLAEYRTHMVKFLDTADNGTTASPLASLSATTADTRIRGAVAFLMTTARFQEQ